MRIGATNWRKHGVWNAKCKIRGKNLQGRITSVIVIFDIQGGNRQAWAVKELLGWNINTLSNITEYEVIVLDAK